MESPAEAYDMRTRLRITKPQAILVPQKRRAATKDDSRLQGPARAACRHIGIRSRSPAALARDIKVLPRIRAEALLHQGLELFVAAQAWLQGIRFGIGVAAAARVAVVLAQRGCTAPLCSGAQPLAYALSPTYKAEGSGAALARFANARKALAPSVQSTN